MRHPALHEPVHERLGQRGRHERELAHPRERTSVVETSSAATWRLPAGLGGGEQLERAAPVTVERMHAVRLDGLRRP